MIYLALGCAALALFVLATGGRLSAPRREWRFLTMAGALVAFVAAAWTGVRGGWGAAIVLTVIGLWLLTATRGAGPKARPSSGPGMSRDEARRILGVRPDASRQEVQSAYTRLMRMAHPDAGGTAGLAAQLNAARDRLLGS